MPTGRVQSGTRCLEAARAGLGWLLGQQNPDGGWKAVPNAPVDAFYKGSYAMGLMGAAAAAERSLNYTKQHLLTPEGDFLPREDPWFFDVHYLYANAYFVIGAQRLNRFEIAMPALSFMLGQQDPEHGGFYSAKTPAGQRGRADTMSTGISAIACLAMGQVEPARKAAQYFQRMIDLQPTAERFYTTIEADDRLGTEFPADQSFWRVIDTREKGQCWYAVGLPFTFAILLHQATGEKRYADLAQWYFDFQSRCVDPWDGGSSGKAAWGCSMLYRMTGERCYRDIALHVAQSFMSWQRPEGWFGVDVPAQGYGAQSSGQEQKFTAADFDVTAEFVLWLGLVGSNVLARDPE